MLQTAFSTLQLFTYFDDIIKNHFPKEEDIQWAYIHALPLISDCMRKKIESMIYGKN